MTKEEYTFVLKQPQTNAANIRAAAHDVASKPIQERQYWSREDFGPPLKPQLDKFHETVDDYYSAVTKQDQRSGIIVVEADQKKIEKLFHWNSEKQEYEIPDELRTVVQSVHGPRQTVTFRHHLNQHDEGGAAAARGSSVYANQLESYYGMPSSQAKGVGQTIGIIELGGGFTQSDLSSYWSKAGISAPLPTVTAVSVAGGVNAPGKDQGSDGEVALDIQIAATIAPAAKIVVYFAPNTESGFVQAINAAVHDTTNSVDIVSISWGGPEKFWSTGGLQSLNGACQAASLLGVTVLAASGDNGASDGEMGLNCDFPASSPWVLACGGTNLALSTQQETAWTPNSGGGVSSFFPKPDYQKNAAVPVTPSNSPVTGYAGRGVPDIAANGDPSTGYIVFFDGRLYNGIGGTSCVSPLWSGYLALVNEINKKNAGFINPILYQNPSALKAITSGNNGYYRCGPGWNAVTGLGVPTPQLTTLLTSGSTGGGGGGGTGGGTGSFSVAPQSLTTSQGTSLNITLTANVNAGQTIGTFNVNDPVNGSIAVPGQANSPTSIVVIYTPNAGFTGTDSFTYSAKDTAGNTSNTATVTIAVKPMSTTGLQVQLNTSTDGKTWKTVWQGSVAS